MAPQKSLPPAKPYDDLPEPEVHHSADQIEDQSPMKSFGEAVSEVILGADEDASTGSGKNAPSPSKPRPK